MNKKRKKSHIFNVSNDTHLRVKLAAAASGQTMQEWVEFVINTHFQRAEEKQ